QWYEPPTHEPSDAARRCHPQRAALILVQRRYDVARQAIFNSKRPLLPRGKAFQAFRGRCPEAPISCPGDCVHECVFVWVATNRLHVALGKATQPASRADPDRAIAIFEQGANLVTDQPVPVRETLDRLQTTFAFQTANANETGSISAN